MALLTQAQYAKARGLTRQAVNEAVRDGRLVLIQGKVDSVMADAVMSPKGRVSAMPSLAESRAAREAYQARLKRLEYQKRQGELVGLAEVDSYVSGMITSARTILLAIPPELKERLAAESDPSKIERLLKDEVHRALSQLSLYRPEGLSAAKPVEAKPRKPAKKRTTKKK